MSGEKRIRIGCLLAARAVALLFTLIPAGRPQDTGTSRVETLRLTSKVFDNTRTIRVLLPAGYDAPERRDQQYPAIYLTDGITVFQSRGFDLQRRLDQLSRDGSIPPAIVVGVDNGGSTDKSRNPETDRANEFLPYPDVGFPPNHLYAADPQNPRGKLYPRFLVEELMPLVAREYRIRTGPANTMVGGFSYGGVSALYTVMNRPGVFGGLLLESTPLWIGADRQLLRDAETARTWPVAVYIASGTSETKDTDVLQEGQQDQEKLVSIIRGNSPKTRVKTVVEPGGTHDPSSWGRRFPAALRFLLGAE
jgi:enterochelin esterase-like enzyme